MHLSFTCFLLSLYQSPLSTKLWHLVKASFIGVLSFNHFPQVRQNGPYIQCARRCPEVPLGKAVASPELAETLGKFTQEESFILSKHPVLSLFITLLKFSALAIFFSLQTLSQRVKYFYLTFSQ